MKDTDEFMLGTGCEPAETPEPDLSPITFSLRAATLQELRADLGMLSVTLGLVEHVIAEAPEYEERAVIDGVREVFDAAGAAREHQMSLLQFLSPGPARRDIPPH